MHQLLIVWGRFMQKHTLHNIFHLNRSLISNLKLFPAHSCCRHFTFVRLSIACTWFWSHIIVQLYMLSYIWLRARNTCSNSPTIYTNFHLGSFAVKLQYFSLSENFCTGANFSMILKPRNRNHFQLLEKFSTLN